MDSIIHLALEEICCEATNGIILQDLWPKLQPSLAARGLPLCSNVKRVIWELLLEVQGLRFEVRQETVSAKDVIKWSAEECELVKIVAPDATRNCFLGIYDAESSDDRQSATQRIILERIAAARVNGIAQNDLAKKMHIPANNMFYQLKKLETQGLIVRQPTVIRKKESSKSGELKNDSIVSTNMLYLHRYGVQLGCQQRLEIIKENNPLTDEGVAKGFAETGDDLTEETAKDDVHVKDFLPALKAICDKLEEAEGKVLVISDIKKDLGYRRPHGHRSWRNLCHKLKDAQVVEECRTLVNKKEVNCLRLIQRYSPLRFEKKIQGRGHKEDDFEQSMSSVKRGLVTEQLVELPILRQVYDMIDAAGSQGLTNTEVCRKLGLCSKDYHKRIFSKMLSRFGFHLQEENHDRCVVYRVWTVSNFNPESSNLASIAREPVLLEGLDSDSGGRGLEFCESLSQPEPVIDCSDSMRNQGTVDNRNTTAKAEASNRLIVSDEGDDNQPPQSSPDVVSRNELLLIGKTVTTETLLETGHTHKPPIVVTGHRRRSNKRYPFLTANANSSQREQRILEMLQEEKFLIKPELHRRLESLDKERTTTMDRKTLERCLNKLQQEGLCKCIHLSAPTATNWGRSKTIEVVLHPSVYNSLPELTAQIHDRMRTFEKEIRPSLNVSLKKNESVPVLDNVQRIPSSAKTDVSSCFCANGFALGKMVRTRLLHLFLWDWVWGTPGWSEISLSTALFHAMNNPLRSYWLFDLDKAIKSMPLKLFLQVVGTAQKLNDLVEKHGDLQISDPAIQYKSLVDTKATGRLSCLIDILRRMKLIRLVSKDNAEDGTGSSLTTLTHALEFQPCIEEPVSIIASTGSLHTDLRPQVRHDFVLSTKKALEDYWNTLEYCYATAEPRAGLHAFPGSAVREVFHSRSWLSTQTMTDEKQAKLLNYMAVDDPGIKLTFTECEKIANDLDLSMEQVLRFRNKRQQRFTKLQRVLDAKQQKNVPLNGVCMILSRKRKRRPDGITSKMGKASILHQQSREQATQNFEIQIESQQAPELNEEDDDAHMLIQKSASSRLKLRQRKFSWTEEADRQLVIQYARHRTAVGAKSRRVNWASILNLPAPPETCKRRLALLKTSTLFRKALMKLCSILAEKYAKHLEQFQDKSLKHKYSEIIVRDYPFEANGVWSSVPGSMKWDDFDASDIKEALDDALMYKRMANLEIVRDVLTDQGYVGEIEDYDWSESSGAISNTSHLLMKHVKPINERKMHKSTAIANAAELFKLIFLSTSTGPAVPHLVAETLRRYSEHDLFAAFNFLKEHKIMIGGSSDSPYVLSPHFLHSISLSPFPMDTGKRATEFSAWLYEREKDLMKEGIDVPSDLQCGELLNLCSRISSGELFVTPYLPDDGVGEAEDNRTSKRKCDNTEFSDGETSKKSKTAFTGEGEIIFRREKGFPGINLYLTCKIIPKLHIIETCKDVSESSHLGAPNSDAMLSSTDAGSIFSHSAGADNARKIFASERSAHLVIDVNDSPWEAMAKYAEHLASSCSYGSKSLSFDPNSFKTLYSAIQKSGDQGLGMKKIALILDIPETWRLEIIVEVLEAFGRVLKVNAHDSVKVADSLYRSKYFLTSKPTVTHENKYDDENVPHADNCLLDGDGTCGTDISSNEMHRVTILNVSKDSLETPCKGNVTGQECCDVFPSKMNKYTPLLPWINGDGTINELVYKGLVRRILGILMQNPGILEDNIINQMLGLNPQSCRRLLETLILDNHVIIRKLPQMTSKQPPSILGSLIGDHFRRSKVIYRVHLFANPMSCLLL